MNNKRFLFYLDWRDRMDMMDEVQLKRFIYNLCNYAEGKNVELPTDFEKAIWLGVLPSLKINEKKYEQAVERSRKNGMLGGAPKGNQNARKEETTQNNPNNLIRDNSKEIIDNCEMLNGNRKEENENSKMETEKWKEETVKSKIENEDFETKVIDAGKIEINEFSSKEKSLEELQAEYMTIGSHMQNLKEKMITVSPHQKNIQRLISNEDWSLLESNLNAEEFVEIKPLLEEFYSLKDNSSQVYQDIVIKYNAAKNRQGTNDQ